VTIWGWGRSGPLTDMHKNEGSPFIIMIVIKNNLKGETS
ncbi:unnamed protein product, partial [marine sediment metagenome]